MHQNKISICSGIAYGIRTRVYKVKAYMSCPVDERDINVVWEARIELAPRVSKTRRLPLSYTQIKRF